MKTARCYDDPWREWELKCEACGWTGTGAGLTTGETFRELYEADCPRCGKTVLLVSYPTHDEVGRNLDELDAPEREMFERATEWGRRSEAAQLRDSSQLPEIERETDLFQMTSPDGDPWGRMQRVVHAGHVRWEEPADYGSYWRLGEVAQILKARYGDRLRDLVPVENSVVYLYGDRFSTPGYVAEVRAWLRGKQEFPSDFEVERIQRYRAAEAARRAGPTEQS